MNAVYVIGLLTAGCAFITLLHFALWRLLAARRANVESLTVEVETQNRRVSRREQLGWFVATLIISVLLAWLAFAVYNRFRETSAHASARESAAETRTPLSHAEN